MRYKVVPSFASVDEISVCSFQSKLLSFFFFLSFDMYTIIYLLYLFYRVQIKLSIQINSSNTFVHCDAVYCAVN